MKIISVFIIISLLTMGKQSKVSKETREKNRKRERARYAASQKKVFIHTRQQHDANKRAKMAQSRENANSIKTMKRYVQFPTKYKIAMSANLEFITTEHYKSKPKFVILANLDFT